MLKLGGIINIAIAAAHVLCLFWLDPVLEWFRMDVYMDRHAAIHPSIPYLITALVAGVFLVFGLYGLSGAGVIRKLPWLKAGIYGIAAVYLLRGVGGLIAEWILADVRIWDYFFSLCAIGIGLLYLLGGLKRWKLRS